MIIKKCKYTEAKDQDGITALHWASVRGNVDVASILLQNNPDVEEKEDEGNNDLGHSFLNTIKMLLESLFYRKLALTQEIKCCLSSLI